MRFWNRKPVFLKRSLLNPRARHPVTVVSYFSRYSMWPYPWQEFVGMMWMDLREGL